MLARYLISIVLLALVASVAIGQEVRPPKNVAVKDPVKKVVKPLSPIMDILYPEQPPQIPKMPFPRAANAIQAVQWMIFSKRETARALRLAQRRKDPDGVARLLVTLEDIRRHSSREAFRFLKAATKPK